MKLSEISKITIEQREIDKWKDSPRDSDGCFTNMADIESWMLENGTTFGNKKLNPDAFTVDEQNMITMDGSIVFNRRFFTKLPVRFKMLNGIYIENHRVDLESLEGLPKETMEGTVEIRNTGLLSLKGSPNIVKGTVHLEKIKIVTLEGCPKEVGTGPNIAGFICINTPITSLIGGPPKVKGNYVVSNCSLVTVLGAPSTVTSSFMVDDNVNLKSLVVMPKKCRGLIINGTGITSLKGIAKLTSIEDFMRADFKTIAKGGLDLLNAGNLSRLINMENGHFTADLPKAFDIINKYLGRPDDIFECQQELIDAGFEDIAQL